MCLGGGLLCSRLLAVPRYEFEFPLLASCLYPSVTSYVTVMSHTRDWKLGNAIPTILYRMIKTIYCSAAGLICSNDSRIGAMNSQL